MDDAEVAAVKGGEHHAADRLERVAAAKAGDVVEDAKRDVDREAGVEVRTARVRDAAAGRRWVAARAAATAAARMKAQIDLNVATHGSGVVSHRSIDNIDSAIITIDDNRPRIGHGTARTRSAVDGDAPMDNRGERSRWRIGEVFSSEMPRRGYPQGLELRVAGAPRK